MKIKLSIFILLFLFIAGVFSSCNKNEIEELEKYISCTEGSYPVIDFQKHSLLLPAENRIVVFL